MSQAILEKVQEIVRYAKGGHLYRTVELAYQLDAMVKREEKRQAAETPVVIDGR